MAIKFDGYLLDYIKGHNQPNYSPLSYYKILNVLRKNSSRNEEIVLIIKYAEKKLDRTIGSHDIFCTAEAAIRSIETFPEYELIFCNDQKELATQMEYTAVSLNNERFEKVCENSNQIFGNPRIYFWADHQVSFAACSSMRIQTIADLLVGSKIKY